MRPATRVTMLLALPCLQTLACASDVPGCTENETRACACPDGSYGSQTCAADGAWTPCGCAQDCAPGYASYDGATCENIDECAEGTAGCDPHATCADTDGSYTCTCDTGFVGDGTSCANIDECAASTDHCDPHATCADTLGGFTCTCNAGFSGDGVTCANIDECAAGTHDCDPNATCEDTDGSYTCACNAGFVDDGLGCGNIDECAAGTDDCDPNATCADTLGGFTCTCNAGFSGDGVTCANIDECAAGTDDCETNATCVDTFGGFTCPCNAGFLFNGAGCDNVDECADGTDDCDANATCLDMFGSFTCLCHSGFTGDGTTCENIDECAAGTDDCDANATCEDTPGSFTCTCNEGWVGDGAECMLDATTYVADLSSRPIRITIDGVGTYDIHAMGRLAQEITYVSMPGTGYRMERIPTGWMVHDLVMRDLAPWPGSTLTALASWAGTTAAHTATIRLDGLGSELLNLTLTNVTPLAADTTVAGGRMAELVIAIENTSVEPGAYILPSATTPPGNSTLVTIWNIFGGAALLPPNLDEAAPLTANSIRLRSVGVMNEGPAQCDPASLIQWMRHAVYEFDDFGDVNRRDVSQSHLDAYLQVIDGTICYGTFPSLLYYFNPTKTYGATFLIDIEIATEVCEAV